MPKYKVWNPNDEGPEDAEEIQAILPEDAAQSYATGIWNTGNFDDSIDLMVMDENGDEYDITVELTYQPSFFAYGQKVKK